MDVVEGDRVCHCFYYVHSQANKCIFAVIAGMSSLAVHLLHFGAHL